MQPKERVDWTKPMILRALSMIFLLSLQAAWVLKADHVSTYAMFVQTYQNSGEIMFQFDDDEMFYMKMRKMKMVWNAQDFAKPFSLEIETGTNNLYRMMVKLQEIIQRSNKTQAKSEPPIVAVYPKNPVELGQPNTLICHVDQFFPPILNVSWFRNGEQVTEDTSESLFLPSPENLFNKYYYLNFVPSTEDVYYCKVEHWGLDKPLLRHWEALKAEQLPETIENVVCVAGLVGGLVCSIVGVILIKESWSSHPKN
ncbi:HLA class II histocompatibility antigen, DP alpha 1 chain-like [Suncus etruscus]|uniref:HLA class II histocompatibility antigen, DP alpha 1 chain-like n=1 Tax=Suncus etruscus TaxID=109475 RepID=UPI0021101A44|nr:HLA class II histocompatibility antigen, DP alpha 1 chain-like [Suncus etruscus]